MKVIGYIGEPAAGKSTKMREIMTTLGEGTRKKEGLVCYHLFPKSKSVVVGIYDEKVFSGTDRLSMGVAVKFREWASKFTSEDYSDWTLYWEGQRFSTSPMFDFFYDNFDTTIYLVEASPEVLKERHAARDNQKESFLKGARTRVLNLASKYPVVKGVT
jgi:hypothetical protein